MDLQLSVLELVVLGLMAKASADHHRPRVLVPMPWHPLSTQASSLRESSELHPRFRSTPFAQIRMTLGL